MTRHYPALIHKEKGSDYGVSFPDFPGCVTAGSTPEDAHGLAIEALQFHVDSVIDDGDDIPGPTSLDETYGLAARRGALVVTLIPVQLPGRARRVNITLDENLLQDIDEAAAVHGMSRSAFLAEGARRVLKTD